MFQDMVNVGCNVIIGNGSDTSIWHDRWIASRLISNSISLFLQIMVSKGGFGTRGVEWHIFASYFYQGQGR